MACCQTYAFEECAGDWAVNLLPRKQMRVSADEPFTVLCQATGDPHKHRTGARAATYLANRRKDRRPGVWIVLGFVIVGVSGTGLQAQVPATPSESPSVASVDATNAPAASAPVQRARGRRSSPPAVRPVATHPFSVDDLALMLRSGFSSPEIMEAVAEKQLVTDLGAQQVAKLRAQGADDKLLGYLQSLPLYTAPSAADDRPL